LTLALELMGAELIEILVEVAALNTQIDATGLKLRDGFGK
jgi:hypothetical protein